MKVFISWSGEPSRSIALAISDWLPSVINDARPFISAGESIDKGARWGEELADALQETNFGIICLTAHNQNSRWLNFEAGSLGKLSSQSLVMTLLLGIEATDVDLPLSQFQATLFESEDFFKLIRSLNRVSSTPAEDRHLQARFEALWPKLFDDVSQILSGVVKPPATLRSHSDMLSELVGLARDQDKRIGGMGPALARDIQRVMTGFDPAIGKRGKFDEHELRLNFERRTDEAAQLFDDLAVLIRLAYFSHQVQEGEVSRFQNAADSILFNGSHIVGGVRGHTAWSFFQPVASIHQWEVPDEFNSELGAYQLFLQDDPSLTGRERLTHILSRVVSSDEVWFTPNLSRELDDPDFVQRLTNLGMDVSCVLIPIPDRDNFCRAIVAVWMLPINASFFSVEIASASLLLKAAVTVMLEIWDDAYESLRHREYGRGDEPKMRRLVRLGMESK